MRIVNDLALVALLVCVAAGLASAAASKPSGSGLNRRVPARVVTGDLTRFRVSDFQCPDAFYWPGYMWMWNGRLTKEGISQQLRDMNSVGGKCPWVLPLPSTWRPGFELEPDYLTPEFMEMFRHTADECARLGMRIWLYDEGGWPSGNANGMVVAKRPELLGQYIDRQETKPKQGDTVQVPADCLGAFLFQGDRLVRKLTPGLEFRADSDDLRVEVFRAARISYRYTDMLNPESTAEFIRLTHEAYWSVSGKYFGNTIPLVFTDEPRVLKKPPWTNDAAEDFQKRFGYDVRDRLPDLFTRGPQGAQTRIDFTEWWSTRFADAYFGQIQDWCHKHNILSAGHVEADEYEDAPITKGFGQELRCLRRLDIPGTDVVWRQLFPYAWDDKSRARMEAGKQPANRLIPKYASSVAHQENRPWAITESFCVYGDGVTPDQMKWLTDYQYVRGLNLMDIGTWSYSTHDHLMAGERPIYGPSNPLHRHMDLFHSYVARLGYILSLGAPAVETAIYYPVRDMWAEDGDEAAVIESHDMLAKLLLEKQCDFDLIDDDVLSRQSTTVKNGRLVVGPMRYHTICVSRSKWMSKQAMARLAEFANAGGKVLWVDNPSDSPRPDGAVPIGFGELGDHIKPLVTVEPACAALRICKRRLANGSIYFVTNEGTQELSCTVSFSESMPVVAIDPETGKCHRVTGARRSGKAWSVPINLEFAGSRTFFFTNEKLTLAPQPPEPTSTIITIKDGWYCRKVRAHRIGEHDLEIDTGLRGEAVPAELGDWQPLLGGDFSGDAEYSVKFKMTPDQAANAEILDLGDVRYVARVVLNGQDLGRRAWQPFVFPVAGVVKGGENELQVTVTNTFANQYVTSKVFAKWPDSELGGYHGIALRFEKESTPSGLWGPVRVR